MHAANGSTLNKTIARYHTCSFDFRKDTSDAEIDIDSLWG